MDEKIADTEYCVDFVGAGPGAPDLITLRGKRLLEAADVLIYTGSLINPQLLEYAPEHCEKFNSAQMTLDEVVDIMLESLKAGKRVVRLHTGDPSIYGAIREQIDRLTAIKEIDIMCNICPGVSSFCAAAASLKAEYTLPGVSQTVILTRVAGKTPVAEKESIKSLASHGATMVVFLSASLLESLAQSLVEGGYSDDTPAALVYKASWTDEKIVRCKISEICNAAEKNNIKKTALVCVGDFLGNDYELSKLYDERFSTEFRKGKAEVD